MPLASSTRFSLTLISRVRICFLLFPSFFFLLTAYELPANLRFQQRSRKLYSFSLYYLTRSKRQNKAFRWRKLRSFVLLSVNLLVLSPLLCPEVDSVASLYLYCLRYRLQGFLFLPFIFLPIPYLNTY